MDSTESESEEFEGLSSSIDSTGPEQAEGAESSLHSVQATECSVLKMLLGVHSAKEEEQKAVEPLWDWVQEMYDSLMSTHPLHNPFKLDNGPRTVMPQLLTLLTDCVQTHRWQDASQVLMKMLMEPHTPSTAIHHVGLELLMQTKSDDLQVHLDRLMKQLKILTDVNNKVLSLDYFFVLIKEGLQREALDIFRNFHQKRVFKEFQKVSPYTSFVSQHLFSAYEGLLYYALWLSERSDQKSSNEAEKLAEEAIKCFDEVEDVDNVMDIFIQPYAQLLCARNAEFSALEVLNKYAQNHEDNPNAWRYLLEHTQTYSSDPEQSELSLRNLHKLLPSESKYLIMLIKLKPEEDFLHSIFCALDFPYNNHCMELWQHLRDALAKNRPSFHSSWTERQDWWPEMHFTRLQLLDDASANNLPALEAMINSSELTSNAIELMFIKGAVAYILMGLNNEYTSSVQLIQTHFEHEDSCILFKEVLQTPSYAST